MTAFHSIMVQCDVVGCSREVHSEFHVDRPGCAAIRTYATASGWLRKSMHGQMVDLCPEHADAKVRNALRPSQIKYAGEWPIGIVGWVVGHCLAMSKGK